MHAAHFGFNLGPASAADTENWRDTKKLLRDVALAPDRARLRGHHTGGDGL